MARPSELNRAARALVNVNSIKTKTKPLQEKYSSYVKSAPSMILINGLGQSLAFWKTKADHNGSDDNRAYAYMLDHIELNYQQANGISSKLFDDVIQRMDSDQYRRATNETMDFLKWLKKFATSELA